MSVIWAEGFDFYGTSTVELAKRGYVITRGGTDINVVQNSSNARTGLGYLTVVSTTNGGIERVFDSALNEVGAGFAMMVTTLNNSNNGTIPGLYFGDVNFSGILKLVTNTNLGLSVYSGGTNLGSSANNIFATNTWFYVEAKVTRNSGGTNTGSIVVRVNGVTVLAITGINLVNQWTRCSLGNLGEASGTNMAFRADDWVIWDTNGTINNNFMGDIRCASQMPSADTAEADWVPSTGSGFSCIDETVPSDTDYIQANNSGDVSEFQKSAISIATLDIAAVVVVARALKTDAGPSTIKLGIENGGSVIEGSDKVLTTSAAYYSSIFERNPNGNIPWLKSAVDTADIRFNRVA